MSRHAIARLCHAQGYISGSQVPSGIQLRPNFISPAEEVRLARWAMQQLGTSTWRPGHFDGVIRHYREVSRPMAQVPGEVAEPVSRAMGMFPVDASLQSELHILDLAAHGEIGAHVDSVKFLGHQLAGICLLSDAIMELKPATDEQMASSHTATRGTGSSDSSQDTAVAQAATVQLWLPRRAAYSLSGDARYQWSHAVLGGTHDFRTTLPEEQCIARHGWATSSDTMAARELLPSEPTPWQRIADTRPQLGPERTIRIVRGRRITLILRDTVGSQ